MLWINNPVISRELHSERIRQAHNRYARKPRLKLIPMNDETESL
jgi:hypothetical protein